MPIPNQLLFSEIKSDLENIAQQIEKFPIYSERYMCVVRTDEAQDIEKSIDSLAKNITEKAKLVKSNLANLKEKIIPLEKMLYERNAQRFKYIMDNYFVEMGKFRKISL